MLPKLLWIAFFGALGALARYGLGGWVQRQASGAFPWGTVAVNLSGCLAFGLIWTLASERHLIGGEWRVILLVGFLGAYTTFSSFVFETGEMMRAGEWLAALGNMALQNVLGLAALFAGIVLGRLL